MGLQPHSRKRGFKEGTSLVVPTFGAFPLPANRSRIRFQKARGQVGSMENN